MRTSDGIKMPCALVAIGAMEWLAGNVGWTDVFVMVIVFLSGHIMGFAVSNRMHRRMRWEKTPLDEEKVKQIIKRIQ